MHLKRIIRKWLYVALIPVLAGMAGCSSTGQYFSHRRQDALDVITIGAGIGSFGAKARIGPLQTGILTDLSWFPVIRGGELFPDLRQPGSGVPYDRDLQALIVGMEISESGKSRGKGFEAGALLSKDVWGKVKKYPVVPFVHLPINSCPSYFSDVQIVAGLVFSIRLGVNPGELLDFLLGWTTLDIYNDDLVWNTTPSIRMPAPPPYSPHEELTAGPKDPSNDQIKQVRKVYPRAYEKWTAEEDTVLIYEFQQGNTIEEISDKLQRQVGSIRSRLIKQGLIEK